MVAGGAQAAAAGGNNLVAAAGNIPARLAPGGLVLGPAARVGAA